MKNLFDIVLRFGISDNQSAHEQRMIRTTNLLNLICIFFVALSFLNVYALHSDFAYIPVFAILILAICSLLLSKLHLSKASFLLFTTYVNLSIFYFCQRHPLETQNYAYYFPVIVSVVLINNPSFNDKFSLLHMVICVFFFIGTFALDFNTIEIKMSSEKILFLRNFNIISAALITAILSFLLTRLISKQNNEISLQNTDLLKAKQVVNASLKEKEVLLAELHHRVKNNLAIISGLLNLQDDATSNVEAKEIIGDSKARIMSMALVHRMLYENAELKSLDLARYTNELIYELFNSYNLLKKVVITEEYDKVTLPVSKSVPLGLILNEIVTNSIKYVFRSNASKKGQFFISIREKSEMVTMVVKDNGSGFPADFNPESENLSLGIYLIKSLAEQIDGSVSFSNDEGARIEVCFALH